MIIPHSNLTTGIRLVSNCTTEAFLLEETDGSPATTFFFSPEKFILLFQQSNWQQYIFLIFLYQCTSQDVCHMEQLFSLAVLIPPMQNKLDKGLHIMAQNRIFL